VQGMTLIGVDGAETLIGGEYIRAGQVPLQLLCDQLGRARPVDAAPTAVRTPATSSASSARVRGSVGACVVVMLPACVPEFITSNAKMLDDP
jgi:hypothetical protein